LVESLLDFGRMEARRRLYYFESLDARVLVRDVTEEFRLEPDASVFTVSYRLESVPCLVAADREALSRALWNLLDNAVKYSGHNREIDVAVERANSLVSIMVQDHGIGVPAAEQKPIFQKFVRGKAARSGSIKGTGLGLSIVRHIVQAHGGAVRVKSVEGKGSAFTIELPAKE